jgi:hypothetical protein
MQQKWTTITREDPLYDGYSSKLPPGMADHLITSARMQKKLQPATLFTLADAMAMVGEYSERTTSHPGITAPTWSRLTEPRVQPLLVRSQRILL